MIKKETSTYHKRQCCTECDWWAKPIGYPGNVFYYWEGFDREVCPKCGSEALEDRVGQVLTKTTISGWWIFKTRSIKYVNFITLDYFPTKVSGRIDITYPKRRVK